MLKPPFQISSDPIIDWIIFSIATLLCLYWLRALRLAREGARLFLSNLLKAVVAYCLLRIFLGLVQIQMYLPQVQDHMIAGVAAFVFFAQLQRRKRSRYIPQSVKRRVISRDLTDEEYDPTKHHIDHVWPFSKGGSHTSDNLRVIDKKKNLKKGAKRPHLKDMW